MKDAPVMKRMSKKDLDDLKVMVTASDQAPVAGYIARSGAMLVAALVAEREEVDRLSRELAALRNSVGGGAGRLP